MPSTSRHYTAYAAHALLFLAMSSTVSGDELNQMTYKGCFSSSSGLTKNDDYLYQTSGYCQPKCVAQNDAVLATSNGDECWCGNELPPSVSKVDDDKCNTPCTGYGSEKCGGDGYYSVYLSGIKDNVGSDNSGSTPSSTNSATTTSASPSVVTQVSPGKTVIQTVHAEPTSGADSSSSSGSSGGGVNSTAVAAGVVVGVVVISAIIAGLFFWIRHRRRQSAEEEYKRTQVSDFIHGSKPPQTGYSSMSDSRLDPEYGNKRNSHGSIADNEDFSRKILRVANPDGSGH